MAKGIGNGYPLAAVVTTQEVSETLLKASHFNTFGGNALGSAVGLAVLNVKETDNVGSTRVIPAPRYKMCARYPAPRYKMCGHYLAPRYKMCGHYPAPSYLKLSQTIWKFEFLFAAMERANLLFLLP